MNSSLQTLIDYGMTPKEALLYTTALQHPQTSISALARMTGEHRVTTHNLCKKLAAEGLGTVTTRNKLLCFTAADPSVLAQKLQAKQEALTASLPDLLGLLPQDRAALDVHYYEWPEGIKEIYQDMLHSKGENLSFRCASINPEADSFLYETIDPMRIRKSLKTKALATEPMRSDLEHPGLKDLYEIRYIPNTFGGIKNDITVYGEDKVLLVMFEHQKRGGVIIRNQALHTTLTSIFKLLRASAKSDL